MGLRYVSPLPAILRVSLPFKRTLSQAGWNADSFENAGLPAGGMIRLLPTLLSCSGLHEITLNSWTCRLRLSLNCARNAVPKKTSIVIFGLLNLGFLRVLRRKSRKPAQPGVGKASSDLETDYANKKRWKEGKAQSAARVSSISP